MVLKYFDINESRNLVEIERAFTATLTISDACLNSVQKNDKNELKRRITSKLIEYLDEKFLDPSYKIKVFVAWEGDEPTGFVVALIHPTYSTYGRKCCTFGWLSANNFGVCNELMRRCEVFARENNLKLLRGPINFPKGLGGIGIQAEGFDKPLLYGISFSEASSNLLNYLEKLGYYKESTYACMEVTQQTWNAGKKFESDGIDFRYFPLDVLMERIDEYHALVEHSFQGSIPMPDTSGRYRLREMFESFKDLPPNFFKLNRKEFDANAYSDIPAFREAWNLCDLEKVISYAPTAIDKKTGKIVGCMLANPNLYEIWLGLPQTLCNVDTVMVDKEYASKGIFSALNNIGQLTCNLFGIKYYEGTYIWYNNPDAVRAILPHGKIVRTHYVLQKRIKREQKED